MITLSKFTKKNLIKVMIDSPETIFHRIYKEDKPYSTSFCLYKISDIKEVIEYFIKYEEYEKCHFLNKWSERRFNHDQNWKDFIDKN